MKRLLALALAPILLAITMFAVNVEASPSCGTRTELRLYSGGNQTGELLGIMCGNESGPGGTANTYSYDEDMGDLALEFRSGDNNNAASFKFYNPTGGTWCITFYNNRDGAQLGGEELTYDHLSPTATWWGPAGGLMTGMINEASAVQIYHKNTYDAGHDCDGVYHQTIF